MKTKNKKVYHKCQMNFQGAGVLFFDSSLFKSPPREGKEGMDLRISFLPLLQIGDSPVPIRGGETRFLLGDTTLTEV
jgi:hypothetical protein